MLTKIGQDYFEVIKDDQKSFDEERFAARYSEILDKYDFIVGDYGYEQLRLKGFYYILIRKVMPINDFHLYKIIYLNTVTLAVNIFS